MVLECCRTARARYLITGDRDLLELAPEVTQKPGLRGVSGFWHHGHTWTRLCGPNRESAERGPSLINSERLSVRQITALSIRRDVCFAWIQVPPLSS